MLHGEQGPSFVRLTHNLIIALEVLTGVPIRNLLCVSGLERAHRKTIGFARPKE
jgi:hypothetical protein